MKRLIFHGFLLFAGTGVCIAFADDLRPSTAQIEHALVERQLWLNNNIGITDAVPSPWTPLKLDMPSKNRAKVDMLGRSYLFSDSLFPAEMSSWGRSLLSAPIQLWIAAGGTSKPVNISSLQLERNDGNKIVLSAFGAAQGLHLVARYTIEYDGMILTDLYISPVSGQVKVDAIYLEIPLKKQHAVYLNRTRQFSNKPHDIKAINGLMEQLPFESPFEPSVWMGDEKVGFSWFAESDRGWCRRGNLEHQVKIFDRDDARVFRLNFVNKPRIIEKSRRITFGLMATPSKQVPPNWRTSPALFNPTFKNWHWDKGSYYPEPSELSATPEKMEELLDSWLKTSFGYFARTFHDGTLVPEYYLFSRFWEIWDSTPKEPSPPALEVSVIRRKRSVSTHRGTPIGEQADWMLWKWKQNIKKYGMRNIYFDGLGLGSKGNVNRLLGAGYTDEDGNLRPTYNILAGREAHKRFYVMMWEIFGEDFNIMVHGDGFIPPVVSFAHARWCGEGFNIGVRRVGRHYSQIVPDEEWLGYFYGRQYGIIGVFLPAFGADQRLMREPTEELMTFLLLHEIVPTTPWCNPGVVRGVVSSLESFGMENVDFFPYWDNSSYISSSCKNIKVSFYMDTVVRDRVLLVVGNTGRQPSISTIKLKMFNPAPENLRAEDIINGETLEIKNGSLEIAVRRLNFRLISLVAQP